MRDTTTKSRDDALAILVDITECIGCRGCVEGCMLRRGIEEDPFEVEQLSAKAYTIVEEYGDADYFARRMCMHCQDPTCASACPVEAIRKTEMGPVIYEARRCLGCRYCMMACPFDVPRFEWNASVPSIAKCDMCVDRQLRGEVPACVEACPVEATISGTRGELLAEAHRRIAADPDKYYDHVYGEHEVGGTSVLFLSPLPFEQLGFRTDVGNDPLPNRTAKVIERIPDIIGIGGAFLASVWWITNRRDEVARVEGKKVYSPEMITIQKSHDAAADQEGTDDRA